MNLGRQLIIGFITTVFLTTCLPSFANQQPLPLDQAFPLTVRLLDRQTIQAHWQTAPGYYLYQSRFKFSVDNQAELGQVPFPKAVEKDDPTFGKQWVFPSPLTLNIPLLTRKPQFTISITFQGCSAAGFCYPPHTEKINLHLNASQAAKLTFKANEQPSSQQAKIEQLLQQQHLGLIALSFFGFGLLLAFTPCVLPMIPILSGIIAGQADDISSAKAFRLSLTYVLAMAITYTLAGIAAGFAGYSLQAALQTPWLISAFSAIFVLMALSLFDVIHWRMPGFIARKLHAWQHRQQGGKYLPVALMGIIASLLASPCITPPLIAALSYIAQTGNTLLGGLALFSLSLGMGLPLLIIGTSAGKLLPKAGAWMQQVKYLFGIMLLALAIWFLQRILSGPVSLILWGGLAIFTAIMMGVFQFKHHHPLQKLGQSLGLILLIYGICLIIGAAKGHENPWHPLITTHHLASPQQSALGFSRIKSLADLQHALTKAKQQGKAVMLDFYADWCASCHELERNTFSDPRVKRALQNFRLLQADITQNDKVDQQLSQALKVIAPPTLLFFNRQGQEITSARLVGYVNANTFLAHIKQLSASLEKQ